MQRKKKQTSVFNALKYQLTNWLINTKVPIKFVIVFI
jgi:hypothetical protein